MFVSLDGGESFHEVNQGVRVSINTDELPGEDSMGELYFNFTDEGLIIDLWTQDRIESGSHADENLGTEWATYEDIIKRLIEGNS